MAGLGGMGGLGVAAAGNLPGRWVAGLQEVPRPFPGGGTGRDDGTGRDRASRTARAGGTSCRPGRAGESSGLPADRVQSAGGRPRLGSGWADMVQAGGRERGPWPGERPGPVRPERWGGPGGRARTETGAAQPEPGGQAGREVRQRPERGQQRGPAHGHRGDQAGDLGRGPGDPVDDHRGKHVPEPAAGAQERVRQRGERHRDGQRPDRVGRGAGSGAAPGERAAGQKPGQRARKDQHQHGRQHRGHQHGPHRSPQDRRDPPVRACAWWSPASGRGLALRAGRRLAPGGAGGR